MAANCVILLDFDNVFLGIWKQDPDLAMRFGNSPREWLVRLQDSYLATESRRWLVTRCYLNPAGWVTGPGNAGDRIYLSRFRPNLVSAGFEVVDCPAMTRSGKNAADIRIVIDALDLLYSRSAYEEFVIASGDSDFAPLLQRIRADDRRITIASPGQASPAYSSLADRVLDLDAIDILVRPELQVTATAPLIAGASDREAFQNFIRTRYSESSAPLHLAAIAQEACRHFPDAVRTNWFDAGGFTAAIQKIGLPHARLSQQYLWDEERHQPPEVAQPQWSEDMPEAVAVLARLLDLPRLRQDAWPHIFSTLARYASEHEFNLTEATRWSRDTLAEAGVPIGRPAIGFVVRGTQFGGVPLNGNPPPSEQQIGRAFYDNLIDRAHSSGVDFDEAAEDEIASWLGVRKASDRPEGE